MCNDMEKLKEELEREYYFARRYHTKLCQEFGAMNHFAKFCDGRIAGLGFALLKITGEYPPMDDPDEEEISE